MRQRPCKVCGGTGRVDLPPSYEETLELLRIGPKTSRQLFALDPKRFANQTAINNRLEELRRLGLVRREWFSDPGRGNHGWLYRIAKGAA